MKFKIGDNVAMTEEAIFMQLDGPKHIRTGHVVDVPDSNHIRVIRPPLKKRELWHISYWGKSK